LAILAEDRLASSVSTNISSKEPASCVASDYACKGRIFMEKVNFAKKLGLFKDYWSPKVVGELNDSYVKVAKLKGEFVWHKHESEDELFLVVRGELLIKLRNKDISLKEGEFVIIPKGVEHLPVALEEVHVVLIEPKSTVNTGNVKNEKTVVAQWI
jgi:mannose-6-phosphate isomerase-like protein (cupin superfamily)